MRGLEGKGVLIVGGTSGIGLATARRFLEEGSRVFVAGNDETELKETRATLAERGTIDGVVGDVSIEADVDAIVRAATGSLSRIDVLINNAGVADKAPFLETATEAWDRTIAINLRGMFLVARAVGRLMAADGAGGAIVNMASTNALGGRVLQHQGQLPLPGVHRHAPQPRAGGRGVDPGLRTGAHPDRPSRPHGRGGGRVRLPGFGRSVVHPRGRAGDRRRPDGGDVRCRPRSTTCARSRPGPVASP